MCGGVYDTVLLAGRQGFVEVVGDGIGRFVIGNGLMGGDGMVGVSLGSG